MQKKQNSQCDDYIYLGSKLVIIIIIYFLGLIKFKNRKFAIYRRQRWLGWKKN